MPTCFHLFGTALLAASLLAGCDANLRDPASPWFRVPPGSELRLLRRIEIPPGRTRVFFQRGAVVTGFDHYAPNCNLEVQVLDESAAQYVNPASYRITAVQDTMEQVVQREPLRVAAFGSLLGLGDRDDGDPMVYLGYHLWLEGPDPNVMRLSCRGAHADLSAARPPSLREMRDALGEIARLVPAGE